MHPIGAAITLYPIGRPVRANITLYPIGGPVRTLDKDLLIHYTLQKDVWNNLLLFLHIGQWCQDYHNECV